MVGVVVLNYGSLSDTVECVQSLLACDAEEFTVVIVDNGSDDPSFEEVSLFSETGRIQRILRLDRNYGYSGGMNRGIEYLLGCSTNVDVIILLNNDTKVRKGFLSALSSCVGENSKYQLATPKILAEDEETIWSVGERVLYPLLIAFSHKGAKDGPKFSLPRDVNCLTGCAMAVRREVFEKVGLLDEEYFAYVEDVDFCRRARAAGFLMTYCPEAIVTHKGAATLGSFSPRHVYLNVRNKAYFLRKNVSWPLQWLGWAWYFVVVLVWMLRAVVLGEKEAVRAGWHGFSDFFKGRMGPPSWAREDRRPSAT